MKKKSLLFNGSLDYISVPDVKDWEISGGKDFTVCGFIYKNKKGKLIITNCFCKDWKKCKGFKKDKEERMKGYTEEDIRNILTDLFEKAIPNKDRILELVKMIADRYI